MRTSVEFWFSLSVPILVAMMSVHVKNQVEYPNISKAREMIFNPEPTDTITEQDFYPAYRATKIRNYPSYVKATLILESEGYQLLGPSIPTLTFEAYFNQPDALRVIIKDINNNRFEPDDYPNPQNYHNKNYEFHLNKYPFSFKVTRKSDGEVIYDTSFASGAPGFFFAENYLEIGTRVPKNPHIYGLGERTSSFRLDTNSTYYTLWTLAQDCLYDTGKGDRGKNMYGHHPVYLELRKGKAHGVFMHNFHAMDVVFGEERATFKVIGGVIDLFIFTGPDPEQVLRSYHKVIGFPALVPYWSLGYHQSRWGYMQLSDFVNVVSGHDAHKIPLDVLWADIDYMVEFQDFTLDHSRYPPRSFRAFINSLKKKNRHFVPIIDAGVSAVPYFGYLEGLEMDVFIKRHENTSDPFIGLVWPGKSAFVDYFHPNATKYWHKMLDIFYEEVAFSGLWLDMNEASSFCDGECAGYYSEPQERMNLTYLPGKHSLEDQLLPLRAWHYGGLLEYDVHSLWGTMETECTYNYLSDKLQKRPFILSRSSRAGHGMFGYHWLGDNYSQWEQLRYALSGVMSFQIFGIPMVGADVCGFHNNTEPELCARWLQSGIFYPFFRNHNDIGSEPQELFALGKELMEIAKDTIRLRYSFTLYLYTLLFDSSHYGGSVFRPIFFEFPELQELYYNQEIFLLGKSMLVFPALYENQREVRGYVPPKAKWFDFYSGKPVLEKGWKNFSAPLEKVNILFRAGHAIPLQDPKDALTVSEMRKRPIQYLIALDKDQKAYGYYYVDDGESLDTIKNQNYTKVVIEVFPENGKLRIRITPEFNNYQEQMMNVNMIKIYGLENQVDSIESHQVQGSEFIEKVFYIYTQFQTIQKVDIYLNLVKQ